MFSESGTWTFCPILEIKGLLLLLIQCTERKAGRESGAGVGSVALVSSSEDTPSLQKGTKNSHVTCRCNMRQEQTSFSTRLHQLQTLEMNYTCKRLQSLSDRLCILTYAFTKHSIYVRRLLLQSLNRLLRQLLLSTISPFAPQAILLVCMFKHRKD